MPSAISEPQWKTITAKETHPSFCAEIEGVDFQNLSDEQMTEVLEAMAKVCFPSL